MATDSLHAFPRSVQTLFDGGMVAGLSDAQLLERFLERRGAVADAAFAAIVKRHGGMVARVCRGVLGPSDLVDDAVQATFLILVQRARSVRSKESLGSWLHGVAYRVSRCALVTEARRRRHEAKAERAEGRDPIDSDAEAIVHEEVARLPERFRAVVVMHYLEGVPCEDIGRSLGWPVGTVKSRLSRARERLKTRLERRGVSDPAASSVLAAGSLWQGMNAAVAVGESFSAPATALAGRVLRMIFWNRLMGLVVILGLGGIGAAVVASGTADKPQVAAADKKGEAQDSLTREYVIEPPDVLVIEVLEALPGRPISGERLVEEDGRVSLGFYGRVHVSGLTRSEAKAKIVLHLRKFMNDEVLGLARWSETIPKGAKVRVTRDVEGRETTYLDVPPEESDRVFVDVVEPNSKAFYLEGEFWKPGRNLYRGTERLRDIIHAGGGLTPWAAVQKAKLARNQRPLSGKVETIAVDLKKVLDGDESANVAIRPGDVLIVPKDPEAKVSNAEAQYVEQARAIRGLEMRMKSIDDTLLKILSALESQNRRSAVEGAQPAPKAPPASPKFKKPDMSKE